MRLKKSVLAFICLLALLPLSGLLAYELGVEKGVVQGYQVALVDVGKLTDLDFDWQLKNDGSYTLTVTNAQGAAVQGKVNVDLTVVHARNGVTLSMTRNAGVLTNIGKDFIEVQISNGANATAIADDISCSADTNVGMSAASTILTNELATNGFTRADGTYASGATGTWTVAKTFTSSGTQTVQLYGLNWSVSSTLDNVLLAYDTSSAKNTVSGDTLAVTWTVTVSYT